MRVAAAAPVLLAGALALGACGGEKRAETRNVVRDLCQDSPSGPQAGLSFPAADGVRLAGILRGDGSVGVVVAHGYGASLCDELPLVDDLAGRGYRVLAYDARGFGASSAPTDASVMNRFTADAQGAVRALRDSGVETIFLVGDSFGGTVVVAAAPYVEPRPAGVVSVGGPPTLASTFGEDLDALRHAKALDVPFLYLVSRHDPYVDLTDARRLVARAPSKDKRLLVFPGGYHAIGGLFVEAPYHDRPYEAFIDFLATRSGARR